MIVSIVYKMDWLGGIEVTLCFRDLYRLFNEMYFYTWLVLALILTTITFGIAHFYFYNKPLTFTQPYMQPSSFKGQ